MHLIISMGIPAKDVNKKQEGFRFNGAVVQIIDWNTKKIIKEIQYTSPPEHLGYGLSQQFKGATVKNGKYYVVTNTELLIYDMSNWTLEKVISLPTFNDLHGVLPVEDSIYVCNTGLEMIQKIDQNGTVLDEINLASIPTYERFDRDTDYRTVATTKPHEIHVNHLFQLDGSIWATYGNLREAVDIHNKNNKLSFKQLFSPDEFILCHDGVLRNDRLYFTTVNAHIIGVCPRTKKILENIDINSLIDSRQVAGWTRGLEITATSYIVGVTKMRHSKFKEYTKWLIQKRRMSMPSSLIEIDISTKKIISIYELKNNLGHAIYSIHKL